jgi:hypothetical protein
MCLNLCRGPTHLLHYIPVASPVSRNIRQAIRQPFWIPAPGALLSLGWGSFQQKRFSLRRDLKKGAPWGRSAFSQ